MGTVLNGGFTGALTVVFGASSPGVLREVGEIQSQRREKHPFRGLKLGKRGGNSKRSKAQGQRCSPSRRKSKEIQGEEEGLFCTGRPGAVNTRGR